MHHVDRPTKGTRASVKATMVSCINLPRTHTMKASLVIGQIHSRDEIRRADDSQNRKAKFLNKIYSSVFSCDWSGRFFWL